MLRTELGRDLGDVPIAEESATSALALVDTEAEVRALIALAEAQRLKGDIHTLKRTLDRAEGITGILDAAPGSLAALILTEPAGGDWSGALGAIRAAGRTAVAEVTSRERYGQSW